MKGSASRAPWPLAMVVIGLCALPLGAQEERVSTVVQPPIGWFGVRLSDQALIDDRGNAFFDSYPVIMDVDSGSPAARAGVLPGDVLLTFNSHDMRGGSVQLTKWLKAGSPFVLRIRRNDRTRVIRGTLGTRPKNWEPNMIVQLSVPEIMERRSGSIGRLTLPRTPMMRVRTQMPTPAPLSVLPPALGLGGGVYPFAGAEFTALNADLCETLGVKPDGVFVTNVIEGSPARAAGLRGGDVVVRADTFMIRSPIDLVQAIRTADDSDQTVILHIVRKRRPQTLTLRW